MSRSRPAGSTPAGLAETTLALERARGTNNPTAVAGCLIVLAFQSYLTRDAATFCEVARAASASGRQAANALMTSIGLGFEGWALSLLGHHEDAEARMAEAQAEAAKIGGRLVAGDWIAAAYAELALNAGRPDEAILRVGAAIEMARAIGGIFAEGLAERVWGRALAQLGPDRREEVDQHLGTSLKLFETGECKVEMAHTHLAWGLICRDRGDSAAATDHLDKAADEFEAAGLAPHAAEARASRPGRPEGEP